MGGAAGGADGGRRVMSIAEFLKLSPREEKEFKIQGGGRRSQVFNAGLALGLHRFLRGFNQTGDKWRHLPDISDNLNLYPTLRFNLFVITIASTVLLLHSSFSGLILNSVLVTCIILQKYYGLPQLVQSVYLLLFIKLVTQRHVKTSFSESVIFLCYLLLCETDVICLFVLFCYLQVLKPIMMQMTPKTASIVGIIVVKSSFFYLGNSNALSTINVGAGYMGLSAYRPALVILQLAVHTYAGPCVTLAYFLNQQKKENLLEAYIFSTWLDLVVFAILCLVFRYHIFVWTVFSPKLLYFGMELVVINLFIALFNIYLFCCK